MNVYFIRVKKPNGKTLSYYMDGDSTLDAIHNLLKLRESLDLDKVKVTAVKLQARVKSE